MMSMIFLKKRLASFLVLTIIAGSIFMAVSPVWANDEDFILYDGTKLSSIYVDTDSTGSLDFPQVVRAVTDLQKDIHEVTDKTPTVLSTKGALTGSPIIVGTVGHSDVIDALAASGKLDVSGITGKWEAFTIQIIDSPLPGVDTALVIAGSDKRGTIYGVYDLSEQIGISPWYWWGDVPIEKKTRIAFNEEDIKKTEMPDVKYRGIFFNDEENFEYWSRLLENDTDSPGTPNANTYAKVFELLLRSKANTLWPAMHELSEAFNGIINPDTGISYNAEKADKYGIIAGSSHCEMLLRNNATEWAPWCEKNIGKYGLQKLNNSWTDSYDYTVNAEAMKVYWEEAVARNYRLDNMYTIGLRGVHDAGINCSQLSDKSDAGKAGVVKSAIEAQVRILEKYEQKYKEETGEDVTFLKIYCSYKEAAAYFRYDISLPSDTVIVYADDNYGYVREVGTTETLSKFPNAGIYYHVSYLGVPQSYLWVASTPLSLMYEEMTKAYNAGLNDCWILNVGDLKPSEIPMEFFLSMGWDHDRYTDETIPDFLKEVAKRDLGVNDEDADAISDIIETYYAVSIGKRPEFQGKNQGLEYSLIDYGDEAQVQINRMQEICDISDDIYSRVPQKYKDAYFQRVHYMLRAEKLTLEKHTYQRKNQLYLNQGRFASVNAYAKKSLDAYKAILSDLKYYNKTMSGGKWDGILDPYTSTRSLDTISGEPTVTWVSEDMAVEGIGSVCEGQNTGEETVTLEFNSLSNDKRFIDVFTTGLSASDYSVIAGDMLVLAKPDGTVISGSTSGGMTTYNGNIGVEERLTVSVDWSKVSATAVNTTITVKDNNGFSKAYPIKLVKPSINPNSESKKGYYGTNSEIAIEAENFSKSVAVDGKEWKAVRGLGRGSDAMKNYPDLNGGSTRIDTISTATSPYLEYNVYFDTTGTYAVSFYRLPTLNEGTNKTNRTGFQFDDNAVYLFRGNSVVDDAGSSTWSSGVRNNMEIMPGDNITVSTAGWHTIRIFRADAGAVFDRIVLRSTAKTAKPSVLGTPESFTTTADYETAGIGIPPVFGLDEITIGEAGTGTVKKYLYDFSDNSAVAAAGYTGVDNKSISSSIKGYAWDSETFANVKAFTRSGFPTKDNGFVYGNAPAGITVNLPKAGKYVVGFSIGDRQSNGISVSGMSIKANGTEILSGLSVAAGRNTDRGCVIDVTDTTRLKLQFEGNNWALSALEIAPYTEPGKDNGTGAFRPDSDGNINIEAEIALENSEYAYIIQGTGNGAGSTWAETYGSSGTAMFSGPNMGNNFSNTSYTDNSGPKLHYKINFAAAGTYNMWVLVKSHSDADDSILISIDKATGIALNDTKDTSGEFKWFRVSINVPSAGAHILSVWEREDGIVLDKIVMAQGGTGPSGTGGKMCREGATVVVDWSKLEALIGVAEILDPNNLLPAQFVAVTSTLATAKALAADATQEQVNAAFNNLKKAIDALIDPAVIGEDITTGLAAVYEFEGNYKNSLDDSQTAVPLAVGTCTAPSLTNDSDRGSGVVKLNSGGGPSNHSKVSFNNPLYGTDMADGVTISYRVKGVSLQNYEYLWSATDKINYVWLTGGLYFGYSGSRGYIDTNKEGSGLSDKQSYLKNGEWNIITTTITESEAVVYINGKKFLTTTDRDYTKGYNTGDLSRIMDLLSAAKTMELGGRNEWWGSGNFYADDFTIYTRALSANETAKLSLNLVNKAPLVEAIAAAKIEAAKTNVYLEESIAEYRAAIAKAEAVVQNDKSTEQQVVNAIAALEIAKSLLKTQSAEDTAAANIDARIGALPATASLLLSHSDTVYSIRADYQALSAYGKSKVTKLPVLAAAEIKLLGLRGGTAIQNLKSYDTANDVNWVIRNNLQSGTQSFGDRTITFKNVPNILIGKDWIRTAMNSKLWSSGNTLCEFDVIATTNMYVAFDDYVVSNIGTPSWLSTDEGFEKTDMTIAFNGTESVLRVFKRAVYAGEHITLGYMGIDRCNYMVIVDNVTPARGTPSKPQKELTRTVKVACVGDSITYGIGASSRDTSSYPPQLKAMLGDSYDIRNFGVSGTTLLKNGNAPYVNTAEYTASKEFAPDIVLIMLGTNDSKPANNSLLNSSYKNDYTELINAYKNLSSSPKVYVVTSPYVVGSISNPGTNDIISSVVENRIVPLQKEIAAAANCDLIDIFAVTYRKSIFPDNVHPNDEGYGLIAGTFYDALFSYLPQGVLEAMGVTGVTLDKTAETLAAGGTMQLTATVSPSGATNKTVSWSSSDTEIATVDANGLVTAKKAGSATITVTTADGIFTAACAVTVSQSAVGVTGVTLNKKAETLAAGGTLQLTATVSPSGATNKTVSWSSSDTEIATVDANGLVTAKKAGSAVITVTTADGTFTAACAVTVKSPSENSSDKDSSSGDSSSMDSTDESSSGTTAGASNNPSTGSDTLFMVILGVLISGLAVIVTRKKRNKTY